jgi:HEAT repeat protein/Na+/melibiose symporter-like transporter
MVGGEVPGTGSGFPAPIEQDGGRELNRLEILRGMRLSVWEGAFATVHGSLTTGAFLTGFALWLGANDLALALLTAIPTLAGLVQIVASYFGQRRGPRKPYVAWFAIAGRTLWIPILLAPFLMPHPLALSAFLVLFAVSFGLLNATVPSWTSWMSDLVPADHLGRYFARRNTVAGIVGMVIGLPAAWFLDIATRRHHWEGAGFGVLFGVAAAGGVASFLTLLRQPEPPPRRKEESGSNIQQGILEFYRAPFADANFRRLLMFNMVFVTGQFFAAPFFTVYALQKLHLDYLWLQLFATLSSLAGLGSMAFWGYLADKFGNKSLLAIGVVGVFTLPILWILTTAEHPHVALGILAANNLAGGLFWAGVSLTQFNLLIRLSPSEKTGVYVATMAALTGLTGGVAPLLGGVLMHALEGWHIRPFGLLVENYHVTFAIAAFLRIFALIFLRPVVDASSTPTRDVLQQLTETNPSAWRHIRRLRGASDEETRRTATAALASSRTRLAVSELVTALRDPSLAVREEAAHALGEIGDPQVVQALVEVLQDPTTGLAGEAAKALGRIGHRQATPALIEMLTDRTDNYAREDRILAIRALGALGGSDAAEALLRTLMESNQFDDNEEEKEVIARALGQIGDVRAAPVLASFLQSAEASRPLRLALVRALGELGHPSALPALREALRTAADDGVLFPLLGDALARLGDTDSIVALLNGIWEQDSPVARRQVAHAIGTLLGEGETLYALLALEEFTRDAAVARLFEEIQKHLRGVDGNVNFGQSLETYVTGEYVRCAATLAEAGQAYHSALSTSHSAASAQCNAALQQIAAPHARPMPLEVVLIAWCALRGALA